MLRFDPSMALVVVDVQNDFVDPAGALAVRDATAILRVVNAAIRATRAAGGFVAYTADWHPPRTPHFEIDGGPWPIHCVGGSWGAAFHPSLLVDGPVVRKGANGEDGYSGFTMRDQVSGLTVPTALDGLLRGAEADRVVVCGLATDHCVAATALDAVELGYDTTVLTDAVRAVDVHPGDGERALARLVAAGVHLETGG